MSDNCEERWNCVLSPNATRLAVITPEKFFISNRITIEWCSFSMFFFVLLLQNDKRPSDQLVNFTLNRVVSFVISLAAFPARAKFVKRPFEITVRVNLLRLPVCWKRQHLRWRNLMSIHRHRQRQVRGVYMSRVHISRILMPIVERVDVCEGEKKSY